jgi:hypothetical protein
MSTDGTAAQQPSGDAEPPPSDSEHQVRDELAASLDEIARSLDNDYGDMSQDWPPTDGTLLLGFWAGHLEKVKQQIDQIQHMVDRSGDVTGTRPGQSPPEPLRDLTAGLLGARQAAQAALRAFQAPDDAWLMRRRPPFSRRG